MKKTLILTFAAAMLLSTAGCASKTDARNDSSATATAASPASAAAAAGRSGAVVELRNDNAYRPGFKPKRLTVLDFNATWCGPCRQLAPVFKEAAAKYTDVDFVSIDVDKMQATANAFGVQSIPTVMIVSPDGSATTYIGTNQLLPADAFFKIIDNAKK